MFIDTGGTVGLSRSVFVSNDVIYYVSGISNLGGQVQCDPAECLPICTSCRDNATSEDFVDELPPTHRADIERTSLAPVLFECALVTSMTLVLLVVVAVWRCRQCATSGPAE